MTRAHKFRSINNDADIYVVLAQINLFRVLDGVAGVEIHMINGDIVTVSETADDVRAVIGDDFAYHGSPSGRAS